MAGGEAGPEEVASQFADDQIEYALIRLDERPEDGSSQTTIKDIFLEWVGPEVGPTDKEKKVGPPPRPPEAPIQAQT